MTTYSVIIGSPPGGSTLQSGAFGSFGCLIKDSTPAERLNMAFRFGKVGKRIEIGMHEGEIFDIRQISGSGQMRISRSGSCSRERVAPRLGVADMFVEIDDEQRHDRLLNRWVDVSWKPSVFIQTRLYPELGALPPVSPGADGSFVA